MRLMKRSNGDPRSAHRICDDCSVHRFGDQQTRAANLAENRLDERLKTYTVPRLLILDEIGYLPIDRAAGTVLTPWGLEIPARPFFGVMGTAPPPHLGRLTSIVPGAFGGNIDNKELTAGSVLYLPVWTEGALFSAGDGHAAQGDGEVCLTAVETGLTGTFRIDLVKRAGLSFPRAETPGHLIAMGFDEDLDEAARMALIEMIGLITERTSLAEEDAYRLCSLAADLRVTQLVNRRKGIHAMLGRWALGTKQAP